MHLSPRFGRPLALLEPDGLEPDETLPFVGDPPDPAGDTARALVTIAERLQARRPDALLLVGDRSETIAAGIAATLTRTPIVHVHGGEESEGAIDNLFRHALTKLSHLHLVAHPVYAERVRQMGEPSENIVVVGVPGVDNLWRDDLPSRSELQHALSHALTDPIVLVTVQPTTLGHESTTSLDEVSAVASALEDVAATVVITQPNSDSGSETIRSFWREWSAGRPNVCLVDALGERRYWGMLRIAAAVVGNSSSGIMEAPAAGVPVVNVGDRQRGRLRFGKVRDVDPTASSIRSALRDALGEAARRAKAGARSDSESQLAAPRVVDAITAWLPRRGARKSFQSASSGETTPPRGSTGD